MVLLELITSVAAGPIRLGGIEFVVVNGTSDLFLLGHSTMIERLGVDVEAILSPSTSSNIPEASWTQLEEIEPNSTESVDSLQAAHGNETEYDESASLLTDNSREIMRSANVELTDRIDHLRAGIEKTAKAGLDGEALEMVKNAVLVDKVECFRAGVRGDDPPADVAICVRLNP